jgi:hypothetical protein
VIECPASRNGWQGEQVDPTATYVQTTPERFDNLALMLGEAADGAAPSLRVEHVTEGSVLIVPDTVMPAPKTFTPAPIVVVERTNPWAVVIAGGGVTSALWLALLRLRRRRHHRPRLAGD